MKFEFLNSTRFWALVLGSAATILLQDNFANTEWYRLLGGFLQLLAGGFIAIKTLDRGTEVLSGRALPVKETAKKK